MYSSGKFFLPKKVVRGGEVIIRKKIFQEKIGKGVGHNFSAPI
jgi:hypothetical protein